MRFLMRPPRGLGGLPSPHPAPVGDLGCGVPAQREWRTVTPCKSPELPRVPLPRVPSLQTLGFMGLPGFGKAWIPLTQWKLVISASCSCFSAGKPGQLS